jgi:outer membrane protein assembly factor BamB
MHALILLSLLLGVAGCFDEFNVPTCSTLADCPEGAIACHESGYCVLEVNAGDDIANADAGDTGDADTGDADTGDADTGDEPDVEVHESACDPDDPEADHCMAWTRDLSEQFESATVDPETAYGHERILIAGKSTLGGRLVALNPADGALDWTYDKDEEALRCPMAIGSVGIVTTNSTRVHGMSPSGEKLWTWDSEASVVGCPAAWSDGQRVFVAVDRGKDGGFLVFLEPTWSGEAPGVAIVHEAPLASLPTASPTTSALEGTGMEDPRIVLAPTATGYQIHLASTGDLVGGDELEGSPLGEVAVSGNVSWAISQSSEDDGSKRHWLSQTTYVPGGSESADDVEKITAELDFTPTSGPVLLGAGEARRMALVSQSGSLHLMNLQQEESAQTGTFWPIGSELASPVITGDSDVVTLDQTEGEVRAYDAAGEITWSASLTDGLGLGSAAMNVIPQHLIVTTRDGGIHAWRVNALGLSESSDWPRWRGNAASLGGE